MKGRKRRDNIRDAALGTSGCRRIARESPEPAYSLGTEGKRNMEEVGIGDKEEYHKI